VDVLAEISANELPLGRLSAHHADPKVHDISIPGPDPTQRLAAEQSLPTQSAVAAEIYRNSGMTYAGRSNWFAQLQETVTPSNMLMVQQQAMEAKLRRPLRAREMLQMRERARASAIASASVLLGTVVCMCGAALAGAVVWRQYGRPKSREELGGASEALARQQEKRARDLRETVGPIVSSVKVSAGAAITAHDGLKNLSAGLKQTNATRPEPPRPR
jgi:anti-sigma factor RsiW